MLIAIIGENCVGKSTLAGKLNEKLRATVYSGKDYLRLEKIRPWQRKPSRRCCNHP